MRGLFARARSYWRGLRSPDRLWSEMDEEMRLHLELEADRLERERGLDREEARRQAAIAFGGVEKYKEAAGEARGLGRGAGLSLDLKLAWRMLIKFPGLTAISVLGIALGVAVGVGAFVLLSTAIYPRLPLDEGERIVALENWDVEASSPDRRSLHDFVAWREELRSVEQIAAASMVDRSLVTGDGPPRRVRTAEMTAAGFQVARVAPLLGRYLVPEDEQEDAPRVAVIGYDLWQAYFDGDPGAIGRPVLLGGAEHRIVGVMPPGFGFPRNQETWVPLRASAARHARGEGPELFVFGRLAPGATPEMAQAEITALGRRAAASFPENARLRPRVLPYTYPLENVRDARLWTAAQLQLLATLLLVAITVNIAVLVYARTAMRQGEIAVRSALGASRRRIVGQLFVEALVLSVVGAGLGLVLARGALRQMEVILNPEGAAFWVDYGLRPGAVAFAMLLAVLSAMVVGVVPGIKSTGRRLEADLRRLGGGATVRLGRGWTMLIVAQVAVAAAVLPTAAHLGFRDLRMASVRATFPAEEVLAARLGVAVPLRPGADAESYGREASARFTDRVTELERRLEAEPRVQGVTFEASLPDAGRRIEVDAVPGYGGAGIYDVNSTGVATDYFDVLGPRVLAGRGFGAADAAAPGRGVVVTEAFARRIIGEGPAIGRRVRFVPPGERGDTAQAAAAGPWHEIVGVVENLYASSLDREIAHPAVYYPVDAGEVQSARLLVRVRGGDTGGFAPHLRHAATAVDPDLRLEGVEVLPRTLQPRYLVTAVSILLVFLGAVLLLSAAGIHALMSLTVTRRRREVGIRAALGAKPAHLLAGIFSRAAWQLGLGGLVGSVGGGALLFVNGVTGRETAGFLGGIVVLMMLVGLVAALGPARRGLRIQPMEALKED